MAKRKGKSRLTPFAMAKRKGKSRLTPFDKVKKHLALPRWLVDQVEGRRKAAGCAFGSQIASDLRDLECYTAPTTKTMMRSR